MFKSIKNLFKKEQINKHVIVCIHGFGVRTINQFDNFKLWSNNEFNLYTFNIFAKDNENDCNPEVWIKRCESVVENFLNTGYEVDLIGFSMGGVIASHLARKYKIGRLFLIAPAFEYFTPKNVVQKTKEALSKKEDGGVPKLPTSFTSCFIDVVKMCKEDIKYVQCPVCIVHGNCDETIPYKSSISRMEEIPHNQKRLFIIHKGKHHLMTNKDTGYETFQIFKMFMNRTIINDKIEFVKDIYNENR